MSNKVMSQDGTEIAYEAVGKGPAVILVEGALGYRAFGFSPRLAQLLAPHFRVFAYDRRGRGESTNSRPFSVRAEIEDLEALIEAAGGSAFVYGISSGACLALEAAMALGDEIKKLAMYEPPYASDEGAQGAWKAYCQELASLLAEGRPGDAIALFMRFVGTPDDMIEGMRHGPGWSTFEALAPTLALDAAEIGEDRLVPVERASRVTVPVLVLDGGANLETMPFMHASATALANAIPHAEQQTLEGQTHDVDLELLAPILIEFFSR